MGYFEKTAACWQCHFVKPRGIGRGTNAVFGDNKIYTKKGEFGLIVFDNSFDFKFFLRKTQIWQKAESNQNQYFLS
jgi:hypothetical protein